LPLARLARALAQHMPILLIHAHVATSQDPRAGCSPRPESPPMPGTHPPNRPVWIGRYPRRMQECRSTSGDLPATPVRRSRLWHVKASANAGFAVGHTEPRRYVRQGSHSSSEWQLLHRLSTDMAQQNTDSQGLQIRLCTPQRHRSATSRCSGQRSREHPVRSLDPALSKRPPQHQD
jgi:hypothetical protein